ncbi:receptor-type tyrosine-protein phosphatase eta [Etheostoma cragini]|uniref:receptor-type tyrosine-protein phosphatase eta n=1 Tax=Etheostoma cragini TaxID=417921 RepID=UPI00155DFE09|nr:receptor-type tyrosine-protein phosphatase eta [Etheostoma cragini]
MSSFTNFTDQTATDFNSLWNSTTQNTPLAATPGMPVEAECVQSPMLSPYVSKTDVNYIEDSCVAMLSFGAWIEKNCSELLPFICYEDRFLGQAIVTNNTSESAHLSWLPGPGNISHYRIEVKGDKNRTEIQTDNLTYDLVNLTAGTGYSVQVFPVKCARDLHPQKVIFYTKPHKVESLSVTNVTETSVFLRWNKPAGNLDFYIIKGQGGEQIRSDTESKEVDSLIPGNLYTFTVHSVVNDKWSEGCHITKYTKPGKVLELRVSNNTQNSVLLSWRPPKGKYTGFLVNAAYGNNTNVAGLPLEVNHTEWNVTGLPVGTEITLSVTALTNGTLRGKEETVVDYTAPGPVSGLVLEPTHDSLTAKWNSTGENSFTVKLYLDDQNVDTRNTKSPEWRFDGLKTAANYTLIVYAFSGHRTSPSVRNSCFTKPMPPTNATALSSNKNQITFQWKPPENITTRANYSLRISSHFWGVNRSETTNNTSYTFGDLKSGTRYDFEVRTVADREPSNPACVSHWTEAEKREISLSMLCSSTEPLLCDQNTTREDVFNQLYARFNTLLGDNVFWELTKQKAGD